MRTVVPPTGSMDLSLGNIPIDVTWCHPKLERGRAILRMDLFGLHGAFGKSEVRADI